MKEFNYSDLSSSIKEEFNNYISEKGYSINDIDIDSELDKWFEQEFEDWYLKKYENDNKRKNIRINIDLPVIVSDTLIDSETDEEIESEIFGEMLNLSRRGLYFRSSVPVKKSSIIKVKLTLDEEHYSEDVVEALAMVVRIDNLDNGEYGLGLMFSTVYDGNQNKINTFVFKRLINKLNEIS